MGIPGYFKAMLKLFQKPDGNPTTETRDYEIDDKDKYIPLDASGNVPKINFVKNNYIVDNYHVMQFILLDANSIIYDVKKKLRCSLDDTRLIRGVIDKIEYIIRTVVKFDEYLIKVYVAFDGVAPLAKLEQQRQRRYRTVYNNDIRNDIGRVIKIGTILQDTNLSDEDRQLFEEALEGLDNVVPKIDGQTNSETAIMLSNAPNAERDFPYNSNTYDTIGITAGTDDMYNISENVKQYFKINNAKVKVSGTDEPGEGEYKCFEFLRENNNLIDKEYGCTLVYGVDADLFMLAFTHLYHYGSIFLFREIPEEFFDEEDGVECIKNNQANYKPDTLYLIDIPLLFSIIVAKMSWDGNKSSSQIRIPPINEQKLFRNDYVLLSMFFGNDFIPCLPSIHFRNLSSVNDMFKIYYFSIANKSRFLCNGNKIQWNYLIDLLREMHKYEEGWLNKVTTYNSKKEADTSKSTSKYYIGDIKTPDDIIKKLTSIPNHERKLEKYILSGFETIEIFNTDFFSNRYYDKLFRKTDNKTDIIQNYLDGIEWTMKYYTIGCVDLNWKYNYYYPPLISDLITSEKTGNTWGVTLDSSTNYLDSRVSLAYVLPKKSFNDYLRVDKTKKEQLIEIGYYPDIFNFLWAFHSYFNDSCVILPEIDIRALSQIILR